MITSAPWESPGQPSLPPISKALPSPAARLLQLMVVMVLLVRAVGSAGLPVPTPPHCIRIAAAAHGSGCRHQLTATQSPHLGGNRLGCLPAHASPVRAGLQLPDQGSLGGLSLTGYCGPWAAQALLLLYSSPESISAHLQRWTPGLRACSPLVEAGERSTSWVGPGLFLGSRDQQWQPLRLLPILVHCSLARSWPWSEGHIPAPNPRLPVVTGPSSGGLDEGAFQASQRGKRHAPPLPTECRVELGISDRAEEAAARTGGQQRLWGHPGEGVTLPARPPCLCRVLNQTGITFNHLNSLKLGFSSSHV